MGQIKFTEDNYLDTIDTVNEALKPYGIKFEDDGKLHDGWCECDLKVEGSLQEKLKELMNKAPLGYMSGRLIKSRSTTEQDVVEWLMKLYELAGD